MRITDAVTRSLCGDDIITGRDSDGLFVKYDRMEIELKTGQVKFLHVFTHVGTLSLDKVLHTGEMLTLKGLEGRMRLTIGGN